jgi:hypothetical protein
MSLNAEPSEVRFEGVQPGTLYVMTISIRNMSKVPQRIRLSTPKTGLFALNYIPAGPVAPGLDLRAEIECQVPIELTDFLFTDKIIATMGEDRIEIPISAIKPHADVIFDKSLHFGNLLLNQLATKEIWFTNRSRIPGTISLSVARNSQVKLSTMKIDLAPAPDPHTNNSNNGSSTTEEVASSAHRVRVLISIEGKEAGTIRELVKVRCLGSVDEMHIDVSASVVEQSLSLLAADEKGLMEIAQFGDIFFGEKKEMNAMLVNSGKIYIVCNI